MFNSAWLIYEALTVEGVSAYIHWPLFWVAPAGTPLPPVTLEDPAHPFTTPKGYTVNDVYYALKHYARWVDADWVRVEATATAAAIKVSAFVSPDGSGLTVILLNTDPIQHVVGIAPVGFAASASTAYRTSGAAERLSEVALTSANAAIMPAQSIVTLAMTR